ncbi:alpha/beta hydrolase family esterase [Sandaracinus amylolyticus]|uniref:Poly(3-hydroxybutyrate) depolymerase n=1 Tax=Sandaracinus amylolyticus TaxID=927083 RepID=A0A0F6YGP7_9BACT|nr:hypothetical protein [Sandaracinus amylolyticus]AKF03097.1 Hypothetical protein DB32_000246 [Sandaracinus amylolyticus]
MRAVSLLSLVLLIGCSPEITSDDPRDAGVDAQRAVDASEPALDAPSDPPDASAPDASSDPDAGPDVARSTGCTSGEGLAEGEHRFTLGGLDRLYRLRLPEGYSRDRAWPLILALHPNGGNAGYWDGTSGDRAIRELAREEAIVLVAQAREGDWRGDLPVELAYFDHVIDELESTLCIDTSRIFSMGFSGGGSFSGVLGCMRDDIRAIASGGAVIYFDREACVGEPAAWITIGAEELIDGRAQFRDFWRDRSGCDATSTATDPAPCTAYDGCESARPIHYCQHAGGHVWPAFGTQAAWDFFHQYFAP